MNIKQLLTEKTQNAFVALGLPADTNAAVTISTKPEFGDYQINGAMAAAKLLKTNPRQLAERLCEAYFYLAKWHQARGDANQALIYYHKTLATNVYEFVEHRYARMEMAKLRGDELSNEQHDFE